MTPSLCHSSFPLKAELEILHQEAFCRCQALHMMYITFRDPERLRGVENVPGNVICHHHSEKVKLSPSWVASRSTSALCQEVWKTLSHLGNERIFGTSPEINSGSSPPQTEPLHHCLAERRAHRDFSHTPQSSCCADEQGEALHWRRYPAHDSNLQSQEASWAASLFGTEPARCCKFC